MFLRSKGVAGRVIDILLEQNVNMSNMGNLDHEALKEFGLNWGDRHALLKAIGKS